MQWIFTAVERYVVVHRIFLMPFTVNFMLEIPHFFAFSFNLLCPTYARNIFLCYN